MGAVDKIARKINMMFCLFFKQIDQMEEKAGGQETVGRKVFKGDGQDRGAVHGLGAL